MKCRACFGEDLRNFVDLGWQPPSNDFIDKGHYQYPLKMMVCTECGLGQLSEVISPADIFSDYMYFSSQSPSWVDDRRKFAHRMINEFNLDRGSLVVDIGSNDGYLLKHFVDKNIFVQGWEPAANVAAAAIANNIPTVVEFWGRDNHCCQADLITATNVLAHTPDMDGFIEGVALGLRPEGSAALEFPHFSNLIRNNQLDTIYHEHYSYISVGALEKVLARHELRIWRVEELATHGGSVRVFACHHNARFLEEESVARVQAGELWAPNINFEEKAQQVKYDFLEWLIKARRENPGPTIGYGAPAKATVLCNYAGIGRDLINVVIDDSPHKQGHLVPGTNIPIWSFDEVMRDYERPSNIVLFAWNLLEPIKTKLQKYYDEQRLYNCRPKLVTAIPKLTVTNL